MNCKPYTTSHGTKHIMLKLTVREAAALSRAIYDAIGFEANDIVWDKRKSHIESQDSNIVASIADALDRA